MVAVNPKLMAIARALRTDAAQRIIVLDATKEGTKILLQSGDALRRPAQPLAPPMPARPLPQVVARAIETQAGIRPAAPAFGEAARAYDQARGDLAALTDPIADDTVRQGVAVRAEGQARDGVIAPVRGDAQQANTNPLPPGQGLVLAGGAPVRKTIDHDEKGTPRAWSLKWWNPGAPRQSSGRKENSPLGRRLAIAAAVIIIGLVIAALL